MAKKVSKKQNQTTDKSNSVVMWVLGGGMIVIALGLLGYLGFMYLQPQSQADSAISSDTGDEPPQELVLVPADASATTVPGSTGTMMMYEPPQYYYSQGASVRTCPNLSDDCKTDIVLLTGDPIRVLGEIEGETWLNSRTWYYVENEGEPGFVHSEFITVSSTRPTSTPAPGIQTFAGQPSGSAYSSGSSSSGSSSAVVCECGYNAYDCKDFSSPNAARACYSYCRQQGQGDVHNMDGDGDGEACEPTPTPR